MQKLRAASQPAQAQIPAKRAARQRKARLRRKYLRGRAKNRVSAVAAVKKKMMSDGAAWKKRNEFIYSAKALGKDKPIPGAKTLMSKLEKQGYTIIYLTARPKMYQDRTINQLREKNFPIHRSFDGGDLVFSKGGPKKSFEFKAEMVRQLQGSYQIDMVFF